MRWLYSLILVLALSACQQQKIRPEIKASYHSDVELALTSLTKMVHAQLMDVKHPSTTIPVDDFFNESSAEISTSGREFQKRLADLLSRERAEMRFSSLNRKNIETAQWIVLASYSHINEKQAEQPGKWIHLKVAVADVLSGQRIASAESFLTATAFQSDPTRFFKDAPLYLNDQKHRERIEVINGKAQPLKQQLTVQAIFSEAVGAYEAGQFAEAEKGFNEVSRMAPEHRGALTGTYQALWQQGKKNLAENAFSNLLTQSASNGTLPIKILFKVNGTDFIDIGDLPQQYRIWTRSMGQVTANKGQCLDVTGHASRSGSADYNNRLSLQRATKIANQIQQSFPGLAGKVKAFGKGFEETIVGTGANDATDAIDRRVEFLIKACG